ncbi:MAG: hypothetical protein U5P10_01545 [Spirochaetia bacterium]|nr:hypothetical protein [Spirochaetia bacterium]
MFYTIRKWVDQGKIPSDELDDKVRRVLRMKKKYGMFDTMGIADPELASEPFSDPIVVQTAKKAARSAILVPKDNLNVVPLSGTLSRVLLVNQLNTVKSPNDRWDHPALFSELLEAEWPGLQTYETDFAGNEEDDHRVPEFVNQGSWDLIICTNFYDRSAAPNGYVKELIDAGYPVLLITNTPYQIKDSGGMIPDAPSIILNMNLSPEGLRTTRDVLCGRVVPQGRWPLSTYNPFQIEEANSSLPSGGGRR